MIPASQLEGFSSGVPSLVVGTRGADQAAISGRGSWRLHFKTKEEYEDSWLLSSCMSNFTNLHTKTHNHAQDSDSVSLNAALFTLTALSKNGHIANILHSAW